MTIIIILLSTITSLVLLLLTYAVYRLWWTPLHVQRMLNSQGIKGPSYKFFHGNTEEIAVMRKKTENTPMRDLSHDIFPKIHPHYHSWLKLYGNNFLHWKGTQPQLVVTEPVLIKEILTNKEGMYPKVRIRGIITKLMGDSVAVTEGEKWFRLRKISNHAFHGESLKDMIPTMVASVESVLEELRAHEDEEIDVSKHFRFLTADVISRTAFGSNYMEGRKIFDMLTELNVLISRTFKTGIYGLRKLMRTQEEADAAKLEQKLHGSVMEIVEKREVEVRTGRSDDFGRDFLGSLLNSLHEVDPKSRISASELIDECKTFYFAGQESTHSLLSWAVFLLSIHTDWQEKARNEALEVFGRENPDSEGLTKLKIVNMILYETLRLYCPVPILSRRIEKDTKLGNYNIPRDMNIVIPTLAVHHNPDVWGNDCHLFKPERFIEGVAKATKGNQAAFLGFGFGPRTCVGLNFAINEAKIALSMILRRYKFTLSENYVHMPCAVLTFWPRHGVQIFLQPL